MPLWMKMGWLAFCIGFFWLIEGVYTFRKTPYPKGKHARTNFILLFFVLLINVLFGILLALVFKWLDQSGFGLLPHIDAPVWVELILALLALDLIAQYFVHFLLHKVKWMWRLHMTHHTDKNVDVTTGTRHHPIDFIIRETFALIAVILMGMPLSFYFFYRILTIPFTYFNHANISLPLRLDKALSLLIVSPHMHKFHHHRERPWTDSNYGNVLSIWDRLFGTFVYDDPTKVVYGLDIADHIPDMDVGKQLSLPFDETVKAGV